MPLNDALMHILVNIMKEVLSVLALATKQIKQGRFSKHIPVRNLHKAQELFREVCQEIIG